MSLTRGEMLAAARARDASYNGRFLTGVLSTGIYCLPSCPARPPKEENIRFFAGPVEARAAGLRPCKRCRPDDYLAGYDPDVEIAATLARRVRAHPEKVPDVAALGRAAGLGRTSLTDLVRRQFHSTPAAWLQRERLVAVRRNLLSSRRRIADLALEAGFESLSTFNDNFRRATGMCPGDYRLLAAEQSFVVALPRDFQHRLTLSFIGRDPASPTERVEGKRIVRALCLDDSPCLLHIELSPGAATCRLEAPKPVSPRGMAEAHAVTLRLLGLIVDPKPFERRLGRNKNHSGLVAGRHGLRLPQTAEPFEGLVWSIVGQQVNLAFAFALRQRLVALAGTRAESNGAGLLVHPDPASVARLDYRDLTRLQFSRRKAEYLIDAARALAGGEIALDSLATAPAGRVEKVLLGIRGIGPWSARYVMMRAFAFADCVPVGDSGLRTALASYFALDHRPERRETEALMAEFSPYRSLATFHLWTSLGACA